MHVFQLLTWYKLVGPRINYQIILCCLLNIFIFNQNIWVNFFSCHGIKVSIVLEMFNNLFFFVCESALEDDRFFHELIRYPAKHVVRHIYVFILGITCFKEILYFIIKLFFQLNIVFVIRGFLYLFLFFLNRAEIFIFDVLAFYNLAVSL